MTEAKNPGERNVPEHIQQTIDSIAEVHARHQRQATRAQRFVQSAVLWLVRPRFIVLLTLIVTAWVAANLILAGSGRAFDPPPFPILQDIGTLAALYITVLILITTQREKEIGEHREQLTLELAILAEQKSAKIIQLIEEARRDNPLIGDRHDAEAAQLAVPADPAAVLDAIKDTHGAMGEAGDAPRPEKG
ncbi:MAG TPA: DUF1003 domain-containing protein [Alphaproteobacteria bacterium]|jgi:uncharacterized membrane protein|nr:DUF1003 domain-containing protein [Alphaproteobacteria bacterium]